VARTSRALRGAAWSVPFWRSEGTAHCVVFPLRFGRDRLTSSQASKKKKDKQPLIPEDQPRTSVPQLSLRRNVNPPGRGLLHFSFPTPSLGPQRAGKGHTVVGAMAGSQPVGGRPGPSAQPSPCRSRELGRRRASPAAGCFFLSKLESAGALPCWAPPPRSRLRRQVIAAAPPTGPLPIAHPPRSMSLCVVVVTVPAREYPCLMKIGSPTLLRSWLLGLLQ
jgi:hypothetical protein